MNRNVSPTSNSQPTDASDFMNLLTGLPKVCTPSLCGLYQTENDREADVSEEWKRFNWSIDQQAHLNPTPITLDEKNLQRLNQIESDKKIQATLAKECDQFFSQELIAPSPSNARERLRFELLDDGNISLDKQSFFRDNSNYSLSRRTEEFGSFLAGKALQTSTPASNMKKINLHCLAPPSPVISGFSNRQEMTHSPLITPLCTPSGLRLRSSSFRTEWQKHKLQFSGQSSDQSPMEGTRSELVCETPKAKKCRPPSAFSLSQVLDDLSSDESDAEVHENDEVAINSSSKYYSLDESDNLNNSFNNSHEHHLLHKKLNITDHLIERSKFIQRKRLLNATFPNMSECTARTFKLNRSC